MKLGNKFLHLHISIHRLVGNIYQTFYLIYFGPKPFENVEGICIDEACVPAPIPFIP